MAEIGPAVSFGAELKDCFKPVNAWVANNIQWLDDVQQFYRERSAIEKEYSVKLAALAKKFFEKKARKSSSLSVGDQPTVTPGSLECASMTTWTVQLTTLEGRAAEHERFSNQLTSDLADPLKALAARYEDIRKQHVDYATKLEKERDGTYAELKKAKNKYDAMCQEVEHRRKKTEGDYGKTKAQNTYQQQLGEMRNVKNSYLIMLEVTNRQKQKYYNEYVPELLDSMQSLNETKVGTLNNIWLAAARTETDSMSRSTQLLNHWGGEIPRNNPIMDSMMFVRHNLVQWNDRPDFAFEPSPIWLDDAAMASDPQSKTYLMNILSKSKDSLSSLRKECDLRQQEVESAKRVRQAIQEGKDGRDEIEVVRAQFHSQELLHDAERRRTTAEVEVVTITTHIGDVSASARSHAFKNQTFKIPTNCDLCGDRIWGLSAKGLTCEDCAFTCHTKCELKVPPDCPGELNKEQKKSIKSERQAAASATFTAVDQSPSSDSLHSGGAGASHANLRRSDTIGSMNTLSSGYATSAQRSASGAAGRPLTPQDTTPAPASGPPTSSLSARPHRVVAPPPAIYASPGEVKHSSERQQGRMLFAYAATGADEVDIPDNETFTLLEPDDGSGWIKIQPASAGSSSGLVPASYATFDHAHPQPAGSASMSTPSPVSSSDGLKPAKKQGPAVAPRRGAKKVRHVEAMYTYAANGPGETSMQEGEKMVLIAPDSGDGWCEVQSRDGKGVVPSSWVQEI